VSVPAPAAIRVWYRLDPWLISGNYGGGFWASPAVLGPTTQGTSTFVVQARARADDQVGSPITDARWVPADPAMVGVSPDLGAEVTITVRRAGRSRLQLASQNGAKELVIAAEYRSEAIVVQIAQ
jgi:hypothetical protein